MIKRKNILVRIFFNPKFLALLGLMIIVSMSFPIAKNISQRHKIDNEIKELQEEIKLIENKNTELRKLIDYLSSEQYVEEQARLNFGLKKKGEEAAVIDLGDGNTDQGDVESSDSIQLSEEINSSETIFNIPGLNKIQPTKPINNPQKWWEYFFEKF
jgi:cell division protein FtsB